MMKFRRLLVHSRFKSNQLSVKQQCGNDCNVKDVIPAHAFTINAGISTSGWSVYAGTSTAGQNVSAGTSTAGRNVSAGTSTAGRNVSAGTSTVGWNVNAGTSTVGQKLNAGTSTVGQKLNAGTSTVGQNVNAGTSTAGRNVNAGTSTARQNLNAKGNIGNHIFAPFIVYKGKAALSVYPALPTFTKLGSGNLVVARRGCIMMKFVSAIGERKYDWEKSQLIALSPTEIGSLISLGPSDSCEFFHDPSILTSNAGEVRKSFSIKPSRSGTGTTGYFISLVVANNILKNKEGFTVPVTTAEFAVMKTACRFALPHIMGWDRLTNKMSRGTHEHASTIDRQLMNSEWDR